MTDTIKEFLVALGFKVDEQAQKKFDKAIGDSGKSVEGLGDGLEATVTKLAGFGAALAATAAGIAVAVTEIESGLDRLYFQAKNASSSANEIKGLEYAFRQLGGSAESADSAINALASFRRHFGTGADRALLQFGVKPEDLNDSVKSFQDLEKTFQRMAAQGPNGQAKAFSIAQALGLSDDAVLVMLRDNGDALKQYEKLLADSGTSYDDAAKSANQYMTQVRDLGVQMDLIKTEVGNAFVPALKEGAAEALKFMHALQTGDKLGGLAGDLLDLTRNVIHLTKALSDLGSIGEGKAAGVGGFLGTMVRELSDVISAMGYMIDTAVDISHLDWKKAGSDNKAAGIAIWNALGGGIKTAASVMLPGVGSAINIPRYAIPGEHAAPLSKGGIVTTPPTPGAHGDAISALLGGYGLAPHIVAAVRAGIAAEGGSLDYSSFKDSHGRAAFGLGQWRGPRLQKLFAKYGHAPTMAQQIAFLISELKGGDSGGGWVLGAKDEASAIDQYITSFMRPQGQHWENKQAWQNDIKRAYRFAHIPLGTGGGINQTNHYQINGTNAHDIASAVGQQQEHSNQRLFANLAPMAQ